MSFNPPTTYYTQIVYDQAGVEHLGDPILYEDHLSVIPHLDPIQSRHTVIQKYKKPIYTENVDMPGQMVKIGEEDATREVVIKNKLPPYIRFDSIEQACSHLHPSDERYYIGYATYPARPALLFISNDLNNVREMLNQCYMKDNSSPIRQYAQWAWYTTTQLSSFMQYTIDLVVQEAGLSKLVFRTKNDEPVKVLTYDALPMAELASAILDDAKVNIGAEGGGKAILDIIHGYYDDRIASICDLTVTTVAPKVETLYELDIDANIAFVRSGLIGLVYIAYSPLGRFAVEESANRIPEDRMNRVIPGVSTMFSQFYILASDGLYYVGNKNHAVSIDNQITADPHVVATLWRLLGNTIEPKNYHCDLMNDNLQAFITRATQHQREHQDQLYFINKTTRQCVLLEMGLGFHDFDKEMKIHSKGLKTRKLLYTELTRLKRLTRHDYAAVIEEEAKAIEEPVTEPLPAASTVVNLPIKSEIEITYKDALIQLRTAIAINKPEKYIAAMKSIPEIDRMAVCQKIVDLYKVRLSTNAKNIPRLAAFHSQFEASINESPNNAKTQMMQVT